MFMGHNLGKKHRLDRIFNPATQKTVIVPVDDSLIFGPSNGLFDIANKLRQIADGQPNAILAFQGTIQNHAAILSGIPKILNLTASSVRSQHTRKVLVGSVKQAVAMGVDGVAAHVNVSSLYESEMIRNLGIISRECEEYGMPLIAIMYPRKENNGNDDNYEELRNEKLDEYVSLVAHAGRIGVELGADVVKLPFTGDADTFRRVVDACSPVPIIIAGGPTIEPLAMLRNAYKAVRAGAAGVSFGRNVFHRENSTIFVEALKQIVHGKATPEDVKKLLSNLPDK